MSFQVMLQQLTAGFGQTLLIFCLTLLFSLPLGMVVYFGRVSRFKPLSWIIKAYISIMRGTPLMLQLLLWYFGPFYLWGMNIGRLQVYCDHSGMFPELCSIFCGNLPFRNRVYSGWSV